MFPLATRKKFINKGEVQFAIDSKCLRELTTGSVASQSISLPSNWVKNHVLYVGSREVSKFEIALQDYERYLNSSEYYWYQWTVSDVEKIMFVTSAVGTSAYSLWYFKKPTTALADVTDESIIPLEYRDASVYWAAHMLLKQIGKTDMAANMLSMYSAFVNGAMTDVKERYMNRVNPNVDTGDEATEATEVDRQGKGSLY